MIISSYEVPKFDILIFPHPFKKSKDHIFNSVNRNFFWEFLRLQ